MNPTRLNLAAKLEGVFSVAGSEKWTYGDHTINVSLGAVFTSAAEASNADDAKLDTLINPFQKYAQALGFVTSNAVGERGPTFINSTTNGYAPVDSKFCGQQGCISPARQLGLRKY